MKSYQPYRSVSECMSLVDANISKHGFAYKEVTPAEAHDLYCVGKELIINSTNSVDTFWKPFRVSRRLVKLDGLKCSFKEIVNDIARVILPKAGDLHFFVVIPVNPK